MIYVNYEIYENTKPTNFKFGKLVPYKHRPRTGFSKFNPYKEMKVV